MKEGWHNDEHFVLFESQEEARSATIRYGLPDYLPDFFIVGLKGWDDFILCDLRGDYFSVPTVPLSIEVVRPYAFPVETLKLTTDSRFENRIKWYIKPVVFGGDPTSKENMTWLSHDVHERAVRYWNDLYRELKGKTA